jgi:hypothetical protein
VLTGQPCVESAFGTVCPCRGLQEQTELAAVRHFEQHGDVGEDPPLPSGIVYCLTRDETETVARWALARPGSVAC